MFFYSWTNVSAEAEGRTEKRHRCEQCGVTYAYTMRRHARAGSHLPFGIGVEDATHDARYEARDRLRAMLRDEIDPMPCPECGWFQWEMIDLMARRRYGWVRLFPLWALFLGLIFVPVIALLVIVLMRTGIDSPEFLWALGGIGGATLCLPG